jgi:Carboxypeptidase regulatory-like domain
VRRVLPTLLALALLLVACARGSGQASDEASGTIVGKVLLAPTCPVEQVSSPCPPRALSGVRVRVVDDEGNVLATAVSDVDGGFEIDVPPGSYLLTASIENDPARSLRPTRVEVAAGELAQANVLVDTGIRTPA